jgi:hypothetical protein
MQQKEETMISLYQLLGRIFYAAAQADGVIQDKEVTTLKTIVRDVWLDFEDALDLHGSDAAYQIEIVFDFLLENEVQVEDVMNEVREFKNIHSSVFTEKLTELIMATSYQIASSFARRNKSELVFLSQLRNVLEK